MEKIKKMYLLPQDLECLKYLHTVKVATYDQIRRDCYPKYHLDSVGSRMRKLALNKLARVHLSRSYLRGYCLVSISKRAFKEFIWDEEVIREELSSDCIQHDLKLVDVRSSFLKLSRTVCYKTENEIQTWNLQSREFNFDALVTMKMKNDKAISFPLEYEATMKSEKRYMSLVKRYYMIREYPIYFFITESESIKKKIIKVEKEIYGWEKPKFFFQTFKDFIEEGNLYFENARGFQIKLASR